MAPTSTEEEGGEGSGGRELRRLTRARGHSLPATTTPPGVGLSVPPTSSRRRRARAGTAKGQSKKMKTSRVVGKRHVAENAPRTTRSSLVKEMDVPASAAPVAEENAPRRSKRTRMGDPDAAAASSAPAVTDYTSSNYSAVSSPIRQPYLESFSDIDPAIIDAYEKHDAKYCKKECRHRELITLADVPYSCLENTWYVPCQDSRVEMILKTAKNIFALSSHIDGELLKHASGFVIEWDKETRVATVLTSAMLICMKSPSLDEWLGKDEFAPDAEVHVHLLDKNGTQVLAELIHYHKHYNLALFKVKMDQVFEIPTFSTEVKCGQEIFVLGRDKDQNFMVNNGNVMHHGPNIFNRHHHMFVSCQLNEYYHGGPVIDSNGNFLGMITRTAMKFIPSVLILECIHMLKKYHCIPRLHTGMKFSAISSLYLVKRERISRKCNVDIGLIVTEVSEGSVAEKVGIIRGDIVESWNGKVVSTTLELENYLLGMCKEHLDNGNAIGSNVEIPVGIYRVRKDSRCTMILTLKVCDDIEVVARGEYDVATTISGWEFPNDQNSGHEEPHGSGEDEVGGSWLRCVLD